MIFDFTDYKRYIAHLEALGSHIQKGFRTRLAEAAGCQSAFVSQVLNGKAQLSLEQGLRLAPFLKLDLLEQRYFLWMIEYSRSGTTELRSYFSDLMKDLRENYFKLQNRVNPELTLSIEAQNIYYSQWYYSAIHILVTIPGLNSIEAISKSLRLQLETVRDAVLFLLKMGLLAEKKGKLSPGPVQLHLDRSSINIFKHHTNWRIKAIESLAEQKKTDMHYSTVSSLSEADVEVIRSMLAAVVESYVKTIKPSKEETLYGFNIDFFKLVP